MRSKLRPFDPIIRYGGDEFLCGMGSIDFGDAQQRFHEIDAALQAEVDVGISFGLATLAEGETADQLTARADALLLEAKASHSPTHARSTVLGQLAPSVPGERVPDIAGSRTSSP
jgi:PleD family two-component response regulator